MLDVSLVHVLSFFPLEQRYRMGVARVAVVSKDRRKGDFGYAGSVYREREGRGNSTRRPLHASRAQPKSSFSVSFLAPATQASTGEVLTVYI